MEKTSRPHQWDGREADIKDGPGGSWLLVPPWLLQEPGVHLWVLLINQPVLPGQSHHDQTDSFWVSFPPPGSSVVSALLLLLAVFTPHQR